MDPRARYPPGLGNGGGGNPNYYGRGPPPTQHHHHQQPPQAQAHRQQYVQRQQPPSQHHNYQQQQWLRRNQIAGEAAGAAGASEHKAPPAADGIDSSSQDWKAQLKLPPPDTRYRTEGAEACGGHGGFVAIGVVVEVELAADEVVGIMGSLGFVAADEGA